MQTEIITREPNLLIRRLTLAPGEAMPWHTDTCRRFTVVVRGDQLSIEMRDSGALDTFPVHAGLAGWDAPEPRVHRGVNTGMIIYEEVVVFFLESPEDEPQPEVD